MTKQLKSSAMLVALLASFASFSTFADYATPKGYMADQPTDNVSRNNYGECWQTTYSADYPVPVECGGQTERVITEDRTYEESTSADADVLFAFDKAELRPNAAATLDNMIAQGRRANARLNRVTVIGHTDAIGSDKYNDALSQRRANTVRNYLANSGIDASVVYAEGRGKREARMTAQCEREVASRFGAKKKSNAKARRAALIACLQPDRRVDIIFQGTETVTRTRTITRTEGNN